MMKKLILFLLFPFLGFGQASGCVQGDCNNGVGTYVWEDGTISNGSWKDGELHGIVQEIAYDNEGRLTGTFDGEMKMGVLSGWGTETLYDDEGYLIGTYVGEFEDNDYNGWGIFVYSDGTIEKGTFSNGELIR